MTVVTTTHFRSHLSDYLELVKEWKQLVFGRRGKKEFIVLPYGLLDEEDIEVLQSRHLAKIVAESRKGNTVSLEEVMARFDIE